MNNPVRLDDEYLAAVKKLTSKKLDKEMEPEEIIGHLCEVLVWRIYLRSYSQEDLQILDMVIMDFLFDREGNEVKAALSDCENDLIYAIYEVVILESPASICGVTNMLAQLFSAMKKDQSQASFNRIWPFVLVSGTDLFRKIDSEYNEGLLTKLCKEISEFGKDQDFVVFEYVIKTSGSSNLESETDPEVSGESKNETFQIQPFFLSVEPGAEVIQFWHEFDLSTSHVKEFPVDDAILQGVKVPEAVSREKFALIAFGMFLHLRCDLGEDIGIPDLQEIARGAKVLFNTLKTDRDENEQLFHYKILDSHLFDEVEHLKPAMIVFAETVHNAGYCQKHNSSFLNGIMGLLRKYNFEETKKLLPPVLGV